MNPPWQRLSKIRKLPSGGLKASCCFRGTSTNGFLVERIMMHASRTVSLRPLIAITGVLAALLWSYWSTLGQLAEIWSRDPQYSHGYVVPAFALVLFWLRRSKIATVSVYHRWWAVLFLFAGCC